MRVMKCTVLACLLLALPLWAEDNGMQNLKSRFAETMQIVDRVVIRAGEMGAWDPGTKIIFDHTDSAKIKGFIGLFEPERNDGHCMCDGDSLVEFFHGKEFVFSFTVHHSQMLRGDGEIWGGDLYFQEGAMHRFLQHFDSIGYRGFSLAISESLIGEKKSDENWENFLALFPADLRHLIPRGRTIEEMVNTREQATALHEAWGETPEAVLTIWRAFATLDAQYGINSSIPTRQPIQTLSHCLKLFSRQTQIEATHKLRHSNDPMLRNGAGAYFFVLNPRADDWNAPRGSEFLARLAEERLSSAQTPAAAIKIANSLLDYNSSEVDELLAERLLKLTSSTPDSATSDTSHFLNLVLTLAERKHPNIQSILEHLLAAFPEGIERQALETGIALVDPSQSNLVQAPHLLCEWSNLNEAALKVIQREQRVLPIALLTQMGAFPVRPPGAPEEIEFTPSDSPKQWARNELAKQGLAPLQVHKSAAKNEAEEAAAERLSRGQYEAAHGIYRTMLQDPQYELTQLKIQLGSGRKVEAAFASDLQVSGRSNNRGTGSAKLSDLVAIRGFTLYANGWFSDAAEDFAAARRLEHSSPQWMGVMQELSSRQSSESPKSKINDTDADDSNTVEPALRWPSAALLFLEGKIDEPTLLDAAGVNREKLYPSDITNLTQAHWLLAELARLENNPEKELVHLKQALAYESYEDENHILAHLRERELRWASESSTR